MRLGIAILLFAISAWAAPTDPCAAASTASDVHFSLALKDGRAIFQEGEIVPLVLSFTSTAKKRYWADVRNYDRSGRLNIEQYCVEPRAADPLESFFKFGGFIGGGLGTERELDSDPLTAEAELNEWRTLPAGHYRVYAVSYRVWRPPDPTEKTQYGRIAETVRSNSVEFEVKPPDPEWQGNQLRAAVRALSGDSAPDDARRAARTLRFLNTPESTRQLARLFWGLNQQQPNGWDLMMGLYGSPYRKLAITTMEEQIAVADRAITSEFLRAIVDLQIGADASWDPPGSGPTQDFWERRRAHSRELTKAQMEKVVAALPRKSGKARAFTLLGLFSAGDGDPAIAAAIRPALVAAWADLPEETQRQLIEFGWERIAGPEMLPVLRQIVAEPPPPGRTSAAMTRDAALKHIFELDPSAGRALILHDLLNPKAQPSMDLIQLLPKEDVATAMEPALERLAHSESRELDFQLVDRYADAGAMGTMRGVFEKNLGRWACDAQSAMLRYFLRVDPEYGAVQVEASLRARQDTGCYKSLLQGLGDQLPQAQQSAIDALDDSNMEVARDAALALGRWGSAAAEAALWARLRRFHQEWEGRADQLRATPNYQNPESLANGLEQNLAYAIGAGTAWISPPDKLARLAELVWNRQHAQQVQEWAKLWKQGSAMIQTNWYPRPTFQVLQYSALTEDQLAAKLAQFPQGTQLLWQFWQPGQISPPVSMATQEQVYERMRSVAEKNGVTLGKSNHP